ncbi:MAG: kinase/pyrophosphorylase [Neisseriales bacterium]|nr:MAG: kinase/pyrophosphorylase [Neisseriales bacterium]
MTYRRSVFFVSDRTCITAESLGNMLLTQFNTFEFQRETIPFVDSKEKASEVIAKIYACSLADQFRPLVFSSIVDKSVRLLFKVDYALCIDFFESFIGRIEEELRQNATLHVGLTHSVADESVYDHRIQAINFSLNHDDGITLKDLDEADVILVGVSRSGKTPTCLYLALQYGINAANYPLTPEDLQSAALPHSLMPHLRKLFGLTIDPNRLHHIRNERRSNSHYASLDNCHFEVGRAESMFRKHDLPFISTTHRSIEEISAKIIHQTGIQRRF